MTSIPSNISELFADLDKRLEELSDYKEAIDLNEMYNTYTPPVSISHISRNLYRFNEDGLVKIKVALNEIEKLLKRKESLVDNISFWMSNAQFEDPYPNEPEKKRSRQLKEYPKLKKELTQYKTELIEAEKDLRKLLKLRNSSENDNQAENSKSKMFVLGDNFKLPKLKSANPEITSTVLSKEQTCIFFNYLMTEDHNIILPFNFNSISKIVSILTFYSPDTLRQSGFGNVANLKKKIPRNEKLSGSNLSNLQIVKSALIKIIENIDRDMGTSPKIKKKM